MTARLDPKRLAAALSKCTDRLLSEMNPAGHWSGELSSSALSTAVAVIALEKMGRRALIQPGLHWLAQHANADGGWGDTTRSHSNLSTTALVWAAFGATNHDQTYAPVVARAEHWLWQKVGAPEKLPQAIIDSYGQDRTFSVPILMTLALSGRLGDSGWRSVLPLPFELAALPQSWFSALQLPVVSYALPALIAIGQCIHHHAPSKNPLARLLRNSVKKTTLDRLNLLQPPNGGFLEATPLTAFVTMSLAASGLREHPVAARGLSFLEHSARNDGSWPIDTNLATWLTTLAVRALSFQPSLLSPAQQKTIRHWLLAQQYQKIHPYTGAAPGGWAWTDLPGGVPDADDTAGALLALRCLGPQDPETIHAAASGVRWLLNLQNRDGGMPTFCRGWGALPFDRSSPELTIHAMLAWARWQKSLDRSLSSQAQRALQRASTYLQKSQRPDGAWIPLWFGNEHEPQQQNPVYGTARTLAGLLELNPLNPATIHLDRATQFLQHARHPNGGWGGASGCPETIEETALASEALLDIRGANRLLELIETGDLSPAPIGLYFARLWYSEQLYPWIFATSALGRLASQQL